MPDTFDSTTSADPALHQAFIPLMNTVEKQASQVQVQAEEIQALRNKTNRLNSEQGKPNLRLNLAANISSERERRSQKDRP